MAQVQLPIFPDGVTRITDEIAFETKDGKVVYYNGHLPVFVHDKDDLATFRFFTSQLTVNGNASQAQIAEAFGVPLVTVKRYVKRFRLGGARAFFSPAAKRSGRRLSAEILPQAQALLDQGMAVPEVARRLDILPNTLHKAIRDGRMRAGTKKKI